LAGINFEKSLLFCVGLNICDQFKTLFDILDVFQSFDY